MLLFHKQVADVSVVCLAISIAGSGCQMYRVDAHEGEYLLLYVQSCLW